MVTNCISMELKRCSFGKARRQDLLGEMKERFVDRKETISSALTKKIEILALREEVKAGGRLDDLCREFAASTWDTRPDIAKEHIANLSDLEL